MERLLTDEEIKKLFGNLRTTFQSQATTESKLEAVKTLVNRWVNYKTGATLKAVIKDLEMIMKEAPDLKSLERMMANYITEKKGEMPEEAK